MNHQAYSPSQIAHTVDFGRLKATMGEIRRGNLNSLNDEIRDRSSDLQTPLQRQDIIDWVNSLSFEGRSLVIDAILRREKENILDNRKTKLDFMPQAETKEVEAAARELNLNWIAYYDSFFKFSNGSMRVKKVKSMDPVLQEVADEADSPEAAQELFKSLCGESESSEVYEHAAGDLPAPIIGKLDYTPKPRLIRFTSSSEVYFEFWTLGSENSIHDAKRGETIYVYDVIRSMINLDIDKGIIQYSSDKNSQAHMRNLLETFAENFTFSGGDEYYTDGGMFADPVAESFDDVDISRQDIADIRSSLAVITTFESFQGQNSTISFSSSQKKDVENEPNHDVFDGNPIRRANVQLLFDDPQNDCDFLSPETVTDVVAVDDDTNIDEILHELEDEPDIESPEYITVSMHVEKNTIRIDKERLKPDTRRRVFKLIAEELGW
ncbi:hypothetical protein [Haloarchaeobius sp. DT45]|uniref:hypothetical protein n=1 Tax=Haloarchaeobius sp. DT45 TaxID=3446116 RepID=UPI003F6C9712